jgi:hypothetical protein
MPASGGAGLKKEIGFAGEVWRTGFHDRRVRDVAEYQRFRQYSGENPVRRGLCEGLQGLSMVGEWQVCAGWGTSAAKAAHLIGFLTAGLKACSTGSTSRTRVC